MAVLVVLRQQSRFLNLPLFQSVRLYQTTVPVAAGKSWRESQGQARTGTEYGPLIDLPDWSFADGRPAPVSKPVLRRRETQKGVAKRVRMLANEMTTSVQRTKDKQIMEKRKLEELQSQKLKPKGDKWKTKNR